jgi:hypothetical protein
MHNDSHKSEVKREVGIHRSRLDDNIKMDLKNSVSGLSCLSTWSCEQGNKVPCCMKVEEFLH